MKHFDHLTLIGLLVGGGLVALGIGLESEFSAFWNPAGMLITVGGSFGALLVNFQIEQVRQVFKLTTQVFLTREADIGELMEKFAYLSQRARREGLLVLEDDLQEIEDPFFADGLQMVIDGFEPEMIRGILETEIYAQEARHDLGQRLYRTWGSLSPAFGMIGTLIGLVQMLSHLDDPSGIGPGMAVALLTTFYGVIMANLIFIPIAGKLSIRSEQEVRYKEAIIEGLISLQQGLNPRMMREKFKAYLPPAERERLEEEHREGLRDEVMEMENA
ncbi:MAG: motility protein A [Dethiobacteria bacterium]|jgi:chemotaxis protein MotA|nr:motility protein A [Bacillota bacterium]